MSGDTAPVFIIGYGEVGRRVAARWIERGTPVRALVRHPIRVSEHLDPRIELYRGDLDDPHTLPTAAMAGARLYYFAPPPRTGAFDPRVRGVAKLLAAPPEKVVLISTTGVYGDCGGDWVNESRVPAPGSDRARRRLDAERTLESYADRHGLPLVTLRVAGIYGPGRLPEKRLREQTPMPAAEDCGYTNRVHIDDLVEACVQAMAQTGVSGILNVSDGAPGTMREYLDLAADALGYPRLPVLARAQMAATLNTAMMGYLGESRRIDNTRLLKTLGISLRHPDLKSGFTDLKDGLKKRTPAP